MDLEMKEKYDEYLEQHISNVKKAYDWLCTYLPEVVVKPEFAESIAENIYNHDRSKYWEAEYYPYCEYFYGTKTEKVKIEFNYAWLHHIHNNPHHWQYWVLKHDDEPEEALDMPYEYIIEMICDWWSFSHKTGKLDEIFSWYEQHKGMVLSKKTIGTVEDILNKIKNKLKELNK